MWTSTPAPLVLTSKVWLGQPHSSDEYKSFLNELRLHAKFDIFLLGGARLGDEVDALRAKFAQLRQLRRAAAAAGPPRPSTPAPRREVEEEEDDDAAFADISAFSESDLDSSRARRAAARALARGDDLGNDDAPVQIDAGDLDVRDAQALFEDATKESGNLMIHMMLLRPQLLAATLGSQWAKGTTFGVEEGSEKHEECLRVTFERALVELNIAFITALRTTLFPGGVAASDRLRLLHSAFFNMDITDLLARIVPAAKTWVEQPWTMPGVVVATAIHRLAHSIQHASTRSLLARIGFYAGGGHHDYEGRRTH